MTDLAARLEGVAAAPVARRVDVTDVSELAERVRPTALSGDRVFPVREDLATLLPFGGLRRGTVVQVGHTGLLYACLAAAMAEGSWAAAVGAPAMGLAAAAEQGVVLERFAVVARPPVEHLATVVAALVDAVDLVVVGPGVVTKASDARRLGARLRERGGVVFSMGVWPEAAELRLSVTGTSWRGADAGHGHLAGWDVDVQVQGRGAASQGRGGTLLLAGSAGTAGSARAADIGAAAVVDSGQRVRSA
jgi:hypothetical protein